MQQLSLLSEPQLYHTAQSGPAYFGGLVRGDGGQLRQECLPVAALPDWLRMVDRSRDTYVSQAQFARANRRVASLRSIGLVWADLDDRTLGAQGDAHAVRRILQVADDARLPTPSLIVGSGRGYHAKWLFERGLPWQGLDRWTVVEREIVARLQPELKADPKAVDAARVLRVVGTTNEASGMLCRVVYTHEMGGAPVRYGFDLLCDEVLAQKRASHYERRGEASATRRAPGTSGDVSRSRPNYRGSSLWWGRLCDLRRLCALRGWTPANGGVPEGYRDLVLFLGAVALSWVTAPASWRGEVEALAAEFTPTLRASECRTYVGSVHQRLLSVREAREGDRPDPRYRYTTARLISALAISAAEQAAMRSLVTPEVAVERERSHDRKRDEKRRRAAGAVPRDVYVGRAAERASAAREMAGNGMPSSAIARHLGVAPWTVRRWLAASIERTSPSDSILAEPPKDV